MIRPPRYRVELRWPFPAVEGDKVWWEDKVLVVRCHKDKVVEERVIPIKRIRRILVRALQLPIDGDDEDDYDDVAPGDDLKPKRLEPVGDDPAFEGMYR